MVNKSEILKYINNKRRFIIITTFEYLIVIKCIKNKTELYSNNHGCLYLRSTILRKNAENTAEYGCVIPNEVDR